MVPESCSSIFSTSPDSCSRRRQVTRTIVVRPGPPNMRRKPFLVAAEDVRCAIEPSGVHPRFAPRSVFGAACDSCVHQARIHFSSRAWYGTSFAHRAPSRQCWEVWTPADGGRPSKSFGLAMPLGWGAPQTTGRRPWAP